MQGEVSKINGVSLWHLTQGEGIPLVLIHGGPGAYDYLEPVAQLLDNGCYEVIRYEQRGSWRSEKKGPYDVDTFVQDLDHLRIHLGVDSWVVCGHSWGASLALAYTAKFPSQVKALIYISGTGINHAWHADYRVNRLHNMSVENREEYTYLRSTVDTLKSENEEKVRGRLRELSVRTDLFNEDNYDMLPRVDGQFVNNEVNQKVGLDWNGYLENEGFKLALSLITIPSLFIHGDVDPRPYKYVNELANVLQNSEFQVIPNAGHYPWLDNPVALRKEINEFLTQTLFNGEV
jgi:proline iminopeptidase